MFDGRCSRQLDERRHRALREVATFGDLPFVVLLDDGGGDEPVDRSIVGEDAHDVGTALDLAVLALSDLRAAQPGR